MLIVMKSGSTREDVDRVRDVIQGLGYESQALPVAERLAVRVSEYAREPSCELFETLPGVELVLPISHPVRKVGRLARSEDTVLRFGSREVGSGGFTIVAGPCAVENEEQILAVARSVRDAGADMLRGGPTSLARVPTTSRGSGRKG